MLIPSYIAYSVLNSGSFRRSVTTVQDDMELKKMLQEHNLSFLYGPMIKEGITCDTLFDLNREDLRGIGVKLGHITKFLRVKEAKQGTRGMRAFKYMTHIKS